MAAADIIDVVRMVAAGKKVIHITCAENTHNIEGYDLKKYPFLSGGWFRGKLLRVFVCSRCGDRIEVEA